MALGTQTAPYIHTSFKNFSAMSLETNGFVLAGREGNKRIDERIEELTNIRESLKEAAYEFLGVETDSVKTIKMNELFGISSYSECALKVLQNREFYYTCSGHLTKYSKQSLNESLLGSEVLNSLSDTITEADLISQVMTTHFNEFKDKSFSEDAVRQKLTKIFNESAILEGLSTSTKNLLRKNGKNSKLYKAIRDNLRASYKNTEVFPEIWPVFITFFEREVSKQTIADNVSKQQFLNKFQIELQQALKKFGGRDASNLMGAGSEEMFVSLMNSMDSNANTFSFQVVGSLSEDEVAKKLGASTDSVKTSLRDTSKQSDSDLLITNKDGMTVRIQAKNYLTPIEKFKKLDKNSESDIKLQAKLFQEESVLSFLDRAQRMGINLNLGNLDEVAYVLANEAWFSTAGNIQYKTRSLSAMEHPVVKRDSGVFQNMIDVVLSDVLLNYLGVMIESNADKKIADIKNSNIFFLIGAEELLPTYKIVDGLISNLKTWTTGPYTVTARVNRDKLNYSETSARKLLEAKESVVQPEGFRPAGGYQNSALVSTGMELGAEIMKKLTLKSINLDVSLRALFNSSYTII